MLYFFQFLARKEEVVTGVGESSDCLLLTLDLLLALLLLLRGVTDLDTFPFNLGLGLDTRVLSLLTLSVAVLVAVVGEVEVGTVEGILFIGSVVSLIIRDNSSQFKTSDFDSDSDSNSDESKSLSSNFGKLSTVIGFVNVYK